MALSKSIEKVALGRIGRIGQLYDAKSDNFIYGVNLFRSQINEIYSTETSCINIELVNDETNESKFDAFGVDPDLQLSVLSGLTQIKNSSYLTRGKKSGIAKELSIFYSKRTVSEEIFILQHQDKIDQNLLQNTEATHVVVGIDWGCNCVLSCEYTAADETANDAIKKEIKDQVKLMQGIFEEECNEPFHNLRATNFSYRCNSDVGPQSEIPLTFQQSIKYLQKIPHHIKEINGGKGIPLTYHMLPISAVEKMFGLKPHIQRNVPLVDRPVLKTFINLFNNINRWKQSTGDLIKDYKENKSFFSDEKVGNIQNFYGHLETLENKLREMLKEVLVDIRLGKRTEEAAMEISNKFCQDNSCTDIIAKMSDFRDFLKEKTLLFQDLNNLNVVVTQTKKDLNKFIKNNIKKTCHVYYINDDFKDPKWKRNKDLFFRLLKTYNEDPQHCFAFVDCSIQDVQNTNIRIEQFVSGKLKCSDYWSEEGENLYKALVKYDKKPKEKILPERGDPVRVSCPQCKGAVIEWKCLECKDSIYYNSKEKSIFCLCGEHCLSGVYFRCSDGNHGLKYFLYPEEQLHRDMENMTPDSETNILILGETGVGKSTWINAFANYLTFDTFTAAAEGDGPIVLIPSAFVLEGKEIKIGKKDEIEDLRVGQSATQFPVTHSFYVGNGCVIRMIDTPGIGDVRGIEQDKKNFENILSHLRYYDKIHAICILLKSNQSRLNVSFRFCLSELLVHLHNSAAANIIFCFTHSRETFYKAGNTMPILKEHLQKQKVQIPITPNNQYYFDSESFRYLAIIKNGEAINEDYRKIYAASWDKACNESSRLMKWIKKLEPHDTTATISLNGARRIIICMMKPLAKISQNIQRNLQSASDKKDEIKVAEKEKKELEKKLNFIGTSVTLNPLPYPRTVCAHKNCVSYANQTSSSGVTTRKTNYTTHCHEHCYLKNIPVGNKGESGLINCAAFNETIKICKKCNHSYLEHQHINYELEEEQKEFINIDVQKKLESKNDHQKRVKEFITSLDKLVKELKGEEKVIINTCAEFACYLKDNSITTFNDAMEDHFNMLIEESENQGRNRREILKLKEVLQKYKDERKAIETFMQQSNNLESNVKQPADIQKKLNELFCLQHNGPEVKDIFVKIEKIQQKEARFLQRPYSAHKVSRSGAIKTTPQLVQILCNLKVPFKKVRNIFN